MLKVRRSSTTFMVLLLLTTLVTLSVGPEPKILGAPAGKAQADFERYLNIRGAGGPMISPNGDRVAFTTNITGTAQVWMVPANGGWPEQMTFYSDTVTALRWSPDGSGFIFGKAVGGDENAQIYWMAQDGSEIRALTSDPKVRHNIGAWSNDSKRISYSSNKRNPNYFDVYVMDVASGREELVYQQDGSNSPTATWSFDDHRIIVNHDNEQLSLDNDLYLVDLSTKQATHLTPHEGAAQFGDVRFAPDGHSIFFGTNDKREYYSLAQMDLATRRVDIIDNTEWDLSTIEMSPDGGMLAYTINREGYSELYLRRLDTDGKPLITAIGPKEAPIKLPGRGVVGALSFSRDSSGEAYRTGNKLAFSFNSSRSPSNIWIYDLKSTKLAQATNSSLAGIPQSTFVEPELITYKSFDGREIPAWYYKPTVNGGGTDGLRVLVDVHGGPEGQARPTFSAVTQYFLSRGYAILAPNVRGSTGYGKVFTHLDDVRNREDSVKDLAASVEWLKTKGGADPARIAVMGGSYGGYMTLAAITLYPELWAAAVDTVGISNFESFLRNTSGYRRKLREVEYGSLERDIDFLRSISPLNRVDRIKTPLMVIQGKNDPRVPYTEAEQIVTALKRRGAVVEYRLFDDEGHGIAKLSNRLIVFPLVGDFLDKYLK